MKSVELIKVKRSTLRDYYFSQRTRKDGTLYWHRIGQDEASMILNGCGGLAVCTKTEEIATGEHVHTIEYKVEDQKKEVTLHVGDKDGRVLVESSNKNEGLPIFLTMEDVNNSKLADVSRYVIKDTVHYDNLEQCALSKHHMTFVAKLSEFNTFGLAEGSIITKGKDIIFKVVETFSDHSGQCLHYLMTIFGLGQLTCRLKRLFANLCNGLTLQYETVIQ